jgi:hypothetical protein
MLVSAKENAIKIEYRRGGLGRSRSCRSNPRTWTTSRWLKGSSSSEKIIQNDYRNSGRRWWDNRRHHSSVRNVVGNDVHSRGFHVRSRVGR